MGKRHQLDKVALVTWRFKKAYQNSQEKNVANRSLWPVKILSQIDCKIYCVLTSNQVKVLNWFEVVNNNNNNNNNKLVNPTTWPCWRFFPMSFFRNAMCAQSFNFLPLSFYLHKFQQFLVSNITRTVFIFCLFCTFRRSCVLGNKLS